MTIYDVDIDARTGGSAGSDRYRGSAILVVNVASLLERGTVMLGEQHLPA